MSHKCRAITFLLNHSERRPLPGRRGGFDRRDRVPPTRGSGHPGARSSAAGRDGRQAHRRRGPALAAGFYDARVARQLFAATSFRR